MNFTGGIVIILVRDITRDGLYKALAPEANPAFSTVFNILHAIGYTLTPTPIAKTM